MFLFEPNIEKLEAKKDVKGLIKALKYNKRGEDFSIRKDAVIALGKTGDMRAVEFKERIF